MTVHELRFRLSQLDGSAHIVVSREDPTPQTEHESLLFEIKGVSMSRGRPSTNAKGRGVFTFSNAGPANWLFISVTPA
jgi:hypothetical protein